MEVRKKKEGNEKGKKKGEIDTLKVSESNRKKTENQLEHILVIKTIP